MNSALNSWESLSVGLFTYFFLELLADLGKKIVILYLPGIMAITTWLVMPIFFYHIYTKSDWQSRLWLKYMPVSSDDYYAFVVPGTLMMILGMRITLGKLKVNKNPKQYLENARTYLKDKPRIGLFLISIGLVSGVLDFLSPASLKQVFYLMTHLTYVGVFYNMYSPVGKMKGVITASVFTLTIAQALINGMFGELIFISALSLILILLGKKVSFNRKLAISVSGLAFIIILQSVKAQYRQKSWKEGGADPFYMGQLLLSKIDNPSELMDKDKLFFVAVRLNQGWLIAVTMDRVPRLHPFANGETIWQSVAASLVPRLVWPDKPEAGGHTNLKRFWGFESRGFSMNIGPIGEAYANFDKTGGIIYMFFYGLFFNLILFKILKLAEKRPTIILWLPFLFMYTIT
ncbi:MAG TPA: hypothetical protein VGM31_10595, partial [Puia sp.]